MNLKLKKNDPDFFEIFNHFNNKEILEYVSISKRTLALFAGQFDTKLFDSDKIIKDFVGEIDKLKEIVNVRTINSLIEKGYLDYDSVYDLVRCHNIIRELSLYEFNLSFSRTLDTRRSDCSCCQMCKSLLCKRI